jgi:hypothetical protein
MTQSLQAFCVVELIQAPVVQHQACRQYMIYFRRCLVTTCLAQHIAAQNDQSNCLPALALVQRSHWIICAVTVVQPLGVVPVDFMAITVAI